MESVETPVVTRDGRNLGNAKYEIFDSLEDAAANLGNDKLVKLLNAKVKADAINCVRANEAQNTPERKIARISRQIKKGEITKGAGAAQLRSLLEILEA